MTTTDQTPADMDEKEAARLQAIGEHQRASRRNKAEQIIGLIAPLMEGRTIHKALSIGAGFGFIDERIKEEFVPDGEFISTDLDKERLFSFDQPTLIKILISATDIEYPDETFDFILAHQVLEHINAYPQVLDKLAVMCKKGGLIYINVPNPISPALGKVPDGTWPKPFLPAFIDHNTRKFKKDFLTDTETYHTGFTPKTLRKHLKDYEVVDLRKARLRQEVKNPLGRLFITLVPTCLLFLFVESNIWACIRRKD